MRLSLGVSVNKKSFHSLLLLAIIAFLSCAARAQNSAPEAAVGKLEVSDAIRHDVSPPLRDIPAQPRSAADHEEPLGRIPHPPASGQPDPVVQSTVARRLVATTPGLNFAGIGNGDYGFSPNAAPPDTNGAVGATQYVQWVNESFMVFNKTTGAPVLGPVAGNTLWSGFGGGCQTNNNGDPVVQYDKAANRWVLTQFSVSTTPFLQCVAVSTTSDATGTYARYAFTQPNFNDYPKLGVWPDGYYISFNMFNGNAFAGGRACAFDRTAMLAGNPATQICFQLTPTFGGLLPSDLDGATPPPAGSPNYFVAFGNDSASLDIWKFHTDFVTPGNATFVHSNIPAPAFAAACGGGGTCIPQSGTTQILDSLADRLMHRLAYRNFGDHEALVVNHSVTAGSTVGIRWYEIRSPATTPTVFQSGTYAPDANFRWMGSIGMDQVGNIALGYSVSSSAIHPAIRYTGRVPTDPLGTLQAENTILNGAGSQTAGLSRWGDYSAMTIDPTDDCTFFYTTMYLKTNGTFNWSTRIASFKFPSCNNATPVLTTITVAPASASVPTGGTQQFSATGLDQFGQPLSPQPTFTWSVSGGGTINATTGLFTAGSTAGGPFTVTASSGGINGTASVTVTSNLVLTTIKVAPTNVSLHPNTAQQFTATGFDQFGAKLNPQPIFTWTVSGGGIISSTGLFTAGSTTGGPFTVTASSGSIKGTAKVTVTAKDFSLAVSPGSITIQRGNTATYTLTITPLNGFTGSVTLSQTGKPTGSTVTFTPNPSTASSTMTVKTSATGPTGTFTITINGKSGTFLHSTTATLVLTP